jgi:hypothetical protein
MIGSRRKPATDAERNICIQNQYVLIDFLFVFVIHVARTEGKEPPQMHSR